MSFEMKNNVLETSTTTGTGTYTLLGAPAGYEAWSTVGANNFAPYTTRMGSQREWGFGQYLTGPARLARSVVLSNGGAPTSWGTGTKEIRLGLPGELLGAGDPNLVGGRLTLDSADPAPAADQLAKTTIYYSQWRGNYIALWNGACWLPVRFSNPSIAVPASTNQVYDIFGYLSGGVLALELLAWTTDLARATSLVRASEGVLIKTGDATRRWLGSFRTTAVSGQTEDSLKNRLLFNANNRVRRPIKHLEATASWTYSTAAYRMMNNSAANRIGIVYGWDEDALTLMMNVTVGNSTATERLIGYGLAVNNTTTVQHAHQSNIRNISAAHPWVHYEGTPQKGYTYFQYMERGDGADTQTWWAGCGAVGNMMA